MERRREGNGKYTKIHINVHFYSSTRDMIDIIFWSVGEALSQKKQSSLHAESLLNYYIHVYVNSKVTDPM